MIKSYANTSGSIHTVRSADGTEISYLTVGSGPSVIVIPGAFPLAAGYAAFAHALAQHFTVHTIERRGQGAHMVSMIGFADDYPAWVPVRFSHQS
jgi:hypothetical protein